MKLIRLTLVLLITSTLVISSSAVEFTVSNSNLTITADIVRGYYTDAQANGVENDVITEFILSIQTDGSILQAFENQKISFRMRLTLPSGYYFCDNYDSSLISNLVDTSQLNQSVLTIGIRMIYWDHALESGDYAFQLTIHFQGYDSTKSTGLIVFDPPGSGGGAPPPPSAEAYM